ncbi:hypothetical protein BDU57DRAFT_238548 [Ampelomyces quisqualis]|uniref:Uncharacterized protein n=1 Tax=Ampelomyces quisqualis TaxID=50730 RepID=A0A6A5QRK4_AMPQU|nr:hypothetical protein BDU57DRAFT_238548 [Ampelomyces quisqualis]
MGGCGVDKAWISCSQSLLDGLWGRAVSRRWLRSSTLCFAPCGPCGHVSSPGHSSQPAQRA